MCDCAASELQILAHVRSVLIDVEASSDPCNFKLFRCDHVSNITINVAKAIYRAYSLHYTFATSHPAAKIFGVSTPQGQDYGLDNPWRKGEEENANAQP